MCNSIFGIPWTRSLCQRAVFTTAHAAEWKICVGIFVEGIPVGIFTLDICYVTAVSSILIFNTVYDFINTYWVTYDDVIKWKHFCVTGPLRGESTGHRWISLTKASGTELWHFLDLRLNKRLSNQSRRRWFETPSRSLWRHCNDLIHIERFY